MSIFNQSQKSKINKNKFDLSHDKKLSCKMGDLIPVLIQEVLPGDRFKVNTEIMMRLAPMIAPVMHRINVYTHYFFVPNRIIWDEWEDFITGGKDGTLNPVHPYIQLDVTTGTQMGNKTLSDYLGIPDLTNVAGPSIPINALPFRAYQTIYNEYYRDQTLTPEIIFNKNSGVALENNALLQLRRRSWEKDYFTSAMPWAQRGPQIGIPLPRIDTAYIDGGAQDGQATPNASAISHKAGGQLNDATPTDIYLGASAVDGGTIADLRKATRLQEWLEKNARGGARYIEQLLAHFGKAPSDARLQRPEYLGGGKQPVVISEVLNTAGSDTIELEPVGEMAGHGISVGSSNGFRKEFEEHGFVIGIMSVIPKTAYMQGLHKLWTRADKLEYAWPEFAQIGEQEIKLRELYFTGENLNDQTFGYTPRYAEYKYGHSTVHGEFKNTLDFWHLGRKFANDPTLNAAFVECTPDDTKRIFAVTDTDTDDLYVQLYHSIDALRPLPYFGTPQL